MMEIPSNESEMKELCYLADGVLTKVTKKIQRSEQDQCPVQIDPGTENETPHEYRAFPFYNPISISGKRWSIFRVPENIKEVDPKSYEPKFVAIGPLHHDKAELKHMEALKLRLHERFLDQVRKTKSEISTSTLEVEMRDLEQETRRCYSDCCGIHDIGSKDLVEMMVIDGCFLVELFCLYENNCKGEDVDEPIFSTRWMVPNIARDLLMMENQVPMCVLKKLYQIREGGEPAVSLNVLAIKFFEIFRPGKDPLSDYGRHNNGTYDHLLALFHSTFVSPDYAPSETERRTWNEYESLPGNGWLQNARSLHLAGVQFCTKQGGLLDVQFNDRTLYIPTLFIEDGIAIVWRNLLAYEQCNIHAAPYFTSLAILFDSIVDTEDDVKVLQDANIIKRAQGDEQQVADLLNSLTKNLEFDMGECYQMIQSAKINNFCQAPLSKFKRVIKGFFSRLQRIEFILSYISAAQTAALFYNGGSTGM